MKRGLRLSIGAKILGGLGALVVLLIVVLVMAFINLDRMQNSQRKVLNENLGNLYDLPALRSNINGQRLAIAVMLETPRKAWGTWMDEINRRRKIGDGIVNRLILRFRDVPSESEKLGRFIAARDAYQHAQELQIAQLQSGKIEEAKAMFLGIQMENYLKMRSIVGELEQMESDEAHAIVGASEAEAGRLTREFLIMGVLGVLIAASLAVYINRTVASYVAEVSSAEASSSGANRAVKMINECNAIVIRAKDETRLLEDICRSIVEVGSYKMAWVGYADDDKNKSVRPMAFAGDDGDYVEHARISWGENERGRGPTGTCIRTGEPVIARDTTTEPGYEPWRYRASEKGYRSSVTMPLKNGERVYGALMVYSGTADAFDDEEVKLLKGLADDLAFATVALRDQLARQQAEKRLRETASYARSLLEASLDPLMAVSPSGKITDLNAAMERAMGSSRIDLIGTDFSECFTEPRKAQECHRKALSDRAIRDSILTLKQKSGGSVDVLYSASAFRNEEGDLQGILAAAREIPKASDPGRR